MLKISTDGRKAALDMRMISDQPSTSTSKLDVAAEQIATIWSETRNLVYREHRKRRGLPHPRRPAARVLRPRHPLGGVERLRRPPRPARRPWPAPRRCPLHPRGQERRREGPPVRRRPRRPDRRPLRLHAEDGRRHQHPGPRDRPPPPRLPLAPRRRRATRRPDQCDKATRIPKSRSTATSSREASTPTAGRPSNAKPASSRRSCAADSTCARWMTSATARSASLRSRP